MPRLLHLTWLAVSARASPVAERSALLAALGDAVVTSDPCDSEGWVFAIQVEDHGDVLAVASRGQAIAVAGLRAVGVSWSLQLVEIHASGGLSRWDLDGMGDPDAEVAGLCLFTDYASDPIWACPGGWNEDLCDFAISTPLRVELERWSEWFNGTDPFAADGQPFPSSGEAIAFDLEGRRLWRLLRAELTLPVAYWERRTVVTIWDERHLPLLERGIEVHARA